jgi:soluble lytic murein transglycosylase-like protein
MRRIDFQFDMVRYDLSSRVRVALRRSRGTCFPRLSRMSRLLQLGVLGLLFTPLLHAAEVANLTNGFSLRHDHHQGVGTTTRLYMSADDAAGYIDVPTADIEGFEPAPPELSDAATPSQKPQDLQTIVSAASSQHQVDADFIASVIHAESANNPRAVSPKGAQGLMQLMPGTAGKLGVKDSFDPTENVDGGVRYLRELLLLYNGDMIKALAAYNAGPQRVEQYKGVPPYRETHAYVARVIKDYNRKKLAERKQEASAQTHQAKSTKPAITQTAANSAAGNE